MTTFPWNTDGSTTIRNTVGEGIDGASLVTAGKTHGVVLAVDGNVLLVASLELLDGGLDVLHSTWLAHIGRGEVGVETSSVPVAWDWLRVEGDLGSKLLSNAAEEETGEPKLVTHLDTVTWTDLELPLCWHDLGVGTRDLDAGVQAGLVVSLDDVTAENLAGTDTAIVWTLWSWVTVDWPSVWAVRHVEESVLLLKTEPWLLVLVRLHELSGLMTVVELVWGSVGIPALAKNEDVWVTAHWVWVDGDWAEVKIRVVTWGLARTRAVKVPFWEVGELDLAVFWDLGDCLYSTSANMIVKAM